MSTTFTTIRSNTALLPARAAGRTRLSIATCGPAFCRRIGVGSQTGRVRNLASQPDDVTSAPPRIALRSIRATRFAPYPLRPLALHLDLIGHPCGARPARHHDIVVRVDPP